MMHSFHAAMMLLSVASVALITVGLTPLVLHFLTRDTK